MSETFKTGLFKRFFDKLLSVILPKNVKIEEIECMSVEDISSKIPKGDDTYDDRFKALFQYRDKTTKSAIWAIKYSANKIIAEKFSRLLYEYIIESISDDMVFSNFTKPIIVPVPASKSSLKKRGYNQCEMIVNNLIKFDGRKNFEFCVYAIKKIRETDHQSEMKNRQERLKNLQGSMFANPNKVSGRNIILIDDVITTGATMKEALRSLKEAGAKKVIGFTLAH